MQLRITKGTNMKQPICAVFDKKSGLFDPPFVCRHTAEALREWEVVKKLPETRYGKNPEDYELRHVGWYDCTCADFESLKPNIQLSAGV